MYLFNKKDNHLFGGTTNYENYRIISNNGNNKNNVFYGTFLGGYTGAQVRESASKSSTTPTSKTTNTPSGNRKVTLKTTKPSPSNGGTASKNTKPSPSNGGTTSKTTTPSKSGSNTSNSKNYGYRMIDGYTPGSSSSKSTSLNNPNVAGAATVSSIEEYLQKTNPTIINKAPDSFSSRINNNRNNEIKDTYNFESTSPKDLKSFIDSVSNNTPTRYINGKKYYIVDSKTAGTLSVGPSIVLKYNNELFEKYGVDVSTLKEGSIISAEIVDKVTNDILNDKKKYVLDVLDKNGITGLTNYQIDALTSRAYSVGNISDFPSEYKKYGNTEALYDNYMSTAVDEGSDHEAGLRNRRK